jgi:transposase-like protein
MGWGTSREDKMAKPSRWTAEKRYQIVKEALSQKEPMAQIARRHQVSEGLIYRWRWWFGGRGAEKNFPGNRA